MMYKLTVRKNGGSPIISRVGSVENDDRPRGLEISDIVALKVKPRSTDTVSEMKDQNQARASLKLMSAALHNYHKKNGKLPTAYMENKKLSWRVHLLPFLNQNEL